MAKKKEVVYDFREGLDSSKIVYKNKSKCDCGDVFKYLGYLLATWIYASAWFALFLYAWIEDRISTFITFLVVWGTFMAILIFGFFLPNLLRHNKREKELKQAKELEEKEKDQRNKNNIINANKPSKSNHQALKEDIINDHNSSRNNNLINKKDNDNDIENHSDHAESNDNNQINIDSHRNNDINDNLNTKNNLLNDNK